ncbi:MAG: LuxR C-terminal-related transcriptional regulator [Rikenellaceae bacterium]
MSKRIHIVIAEPSAIIRCGVASLLQRATLLSIEAIEVSDVASITSIAYKTPPDVVIVNPSYLGLLSPSQIRSDLQNDALKIVAMQSTLIDQSLLQSYDELFSIYDSEESIIEKITNLAKDNQEREERKELSQREKEIIVCVVKGMTNKQMADSLCLSTHTVIAHRRNIASKLQIHSPSGLTIYAIVNKLVDLTDIKNSISQGREE